MREGHAEHSAYLLAQALNMQLVAQALAYIRYRATSVVFHRYTVFMNQRKLLKRCKRRCGKTEYIFIPLDP